MIVSDITRDFKIAPAGNHMARLYSIIDLGHQSVEWDGESKIMHKVVFTWELHGDDDAGEPLNGAGAIAKVVASVIATTVAASRLHPKQHK